MDEAGVAGWVTSDELAEAGRFVREGRRRDYLTWRAVVRRDLGADFSRAAPRYMSPSELALSGDPLLPAAVWCAKEALYKYARRPGLDLLHDLRVEAVDFAAGTVVGRIGGGEAIRLTLHRADGFITVYTV